MPIYKYKGQKPSGEIYEAEKEAAEKFSLYRDVRAAGDTVLSTEEVKPVSLNLNFDFLVNLVLRISTRDKILFARNLGSMLKAGLALSRALSIIERQTKKKSLVAVVRKINSEVVTGKTLSDSLKLFPKIFSPLFVSMVRAGEESGSLPLALLNVSDQMNQMYVLQKKVRGALIYPAIIVTLMIVIAIVMLIYVVPSIAAIFNDIDAELPITTKILIFSSTFLVENSFISLFSVFVLISGFYMFLRSKFGGSLMDTFYLKLPIIGNIVVEVNSARTARTLASLLGSGVEVIESIGITREVVQNHHFKNVLTKAEERIKKGETMSAVFTESSKYYPVFVGEMISIGEETGQLSETLSNVATFYEDEVSEKTKNLSTIVEPLLMILIGVAVVFFALSILGPIYSLADKFGT